MTTPMGIPIPSRSAVLALIDQICDRYEVARLAEQRPRIDDYLRDAPEAERSALLHELLRLERAYLQRDQRQRWQRGECVLVQAYLEEAPPLRDYPELVFELVCGEVLLREELGERPRPADYLAPRDFFRGVRGACRAGSLAIGSESAQPTS